MVGVVPLFFVFLFFRLRGREVLKFKEALGGSRDIEGLYMTWRYPSWGNDLEDPAIRTALQKHTGLKMRKFTKGRNSQRDEIHKGTRI